MSYGATAGSEYPTVATGSVYAASNVFWTFHNLAVNGSQISSLTSRASATDAYYKSTNSKNLIVVWAGTNDIVLGGVSGTTAYNSLVTYCQARQATGWKVIVLTMLPRQENTIPTFEAQKVAFNNLVVANWATFADGLANVAADSRIGDAGDDADTTYYNVDRIHLNDAGYAVVAGIVKDAIVALVPK